MPSGELLVAVDLAFVVSVQDEEPSSPTRLDLWALLGRASGPRERGIWMEIEGQGQGRYLRGGERVVVLRREQLESLPLPSFIAFHLRKLGVVRVIRTDQTVGYLLDPRRLPWPEAA